MKHGLFRPAAFFLAALLFLNCAAFAESGADLFSWKLLDDGSAMITGYKGSGTDLFLPETIEGHAVTSLSGNFGFNTPSVKSLRTVTIPDSVTAIEPGALLFAEFLTEIRFSGDHPVLTFSDGVLYNTEKQSIVLYLQSNTAKHFDVPENIREIEDKAFFRAGLVSVSLSGSTERIGRECFNQCASLADISLSEGLKTIGTDAFANCDKLKQIDIPASVSEIGEAAFTDNRLEEIRVAPDNPVFTVSDGALINMRDGTVIAFPVKAEAESCTIPEGVTRIGRFAFYRCHNLKQVIFPDGLSEIGRGAFVSCNHLTSIDLPDSVTLLEASAFEGNSDADSLHIPSGLTEIVSNFSSSGFSALEIPENVTSIDGSFRSLPNLTEAVLPGSVSMIGSNSFAFCKNLARITIPAGVTEIGTNFTGCAETLVIRVEPGSAAEQYCRDHHLEYDFIQE